jgi:glycerate kinase
MHAIQAFEFITQEGKIIGPDELPDTRDVDDIAEVRVKESGSEILNDLEILLPCDVANPLLGPNGAAYVYGP